MPDNKTDKDTLLSQLLNALEQSLSKHLYETLFSGFSIKEMSINNNIIFVADNKMKKEWIETRYSSLLKKLLKNITNNDFGISIVVIENDVRNSKNNPGISVDSAYDFLFESENNGFDEEYKDYIDNKELDELWKQAFGTEEYERQKALHEKRKQKDDYNEADLNILECVFCGSDDVPNIQLDIDLQPNVKSIVSINVKIRAAKCSKCGEEYYDSEATELVRKIEKLIETKSNL
ncbi:DnaA N-terminal domain-containing protein [Brevibacillus sp. B_LB10_24]|uniref:DnaA N-terminal domain-containing protein n=1 Tax=Brevibacillus sp. B_LB10_24 TaxID=3380645 RepID=UPI0038B7A6E3